MKPIVHRRWPWAACVALLASGAAASLGHAQTPAEAASYWQALTRLDSQAALALIEQSHPGAAAELHDEVFQSRLDTAKRHRDERLPAVTDIAGYTAVMAGLATDFKDGHIWSRPTVRPVLVQWTGMMLARQARQWVVASQLPIPGQPDVSHARLLSCDGVDAETWARQRIDLFRGNAQIEAERVNAATWLLLDEGNPFLKRPSACVFQRANEAPVAITLHWGGATRDVLDEAQEKASHDVSVGLDVQPFDGGYWIDLGKLSADAAQLVSEATRLQASLRAAPVVVVDVRGNAGGNSRYAEQLAEVLTGTSRVAALDRAAPCSGDYWRVSPGNLEARAAWRPNGDSAQLAAYDATTAQMRQTLATGGAFAPGLPPCARQAATPAASKAQALPASLMKGRLIIVTDHACFSSCLLTVDLFRRLGAVQVGEATDMSTRYMEVRQITLPSGLSKFSTLQKVALGAGDFGPYEPAKPFAGNMADTAALKAWVSSIAH